MAKPTIVKDKQNVSVAGDFHVGEFFERKGKLMQSCSVSTLIRKVPAPAYQMAALVVDTGVVTYIDTADIVTPITALHISYRERGAHQHG